MDHCYRVVSPSNPEIAAELFISGKAVEYHLGNVYAKCGLRDGRSFGASSSNGASRQPYDRFQTCAGTGQRVGVI